MASYESYFLDLIKKTQIKGLCLRVILHVNLCMSAKRQHIRVPYCDLCFGYLCFFNVYFNKRVVCILLYDIKPNQNNLLLAMHMRSFPHCVQRNYFNLRLWNTDAIKPEQARFIDCRHSARPLLLTRSCGCLDTKPHRGAPCSLVWRDALTDSDVRRCQAPQQFSLNLDHHLIFADAFST